MTWKIAVFSIAYFLARSEEKELGKDGEDTGSHYNPR